MDQQKPLPQFAPGKRVLGDAREDASRKLADAYEDGNSIRDIAEAVNRSYAWVHGLLLEAGVRLRPRGGDMRSGVA